MKIVEGFKGKGHIVYEPSISCIIISFMVSWMSEFSDFLLSIPVSLYTYSTFPGLNLAYYQADSDTIFPRT